MGVGGLHSTLPPCLGAGGSPTLLGPGPLPTILSSDFREPLVWPMKGAPGPSWLWPRPGSRALCQPAVWLPGQCPRSVMLVIWEVAPSQPEDLGLSMAAQTSERAGWGGEVKDQSSALGNPSRTGDSAPPSGSLSTGRRGPCPGERPADGEHGYVLGTRCACGLGPRTPPRFLPPAEGPV